MEFSGIIKSGALVALVFTTLLTANTYGQRAINQNAILFAGNAFYWSNATTDTLTEEDKETGEYVTRIVRYESAIALMNKDTVYNSDGYKNTQAPVFKYNGLDASRYLTGIFKGKKEYAGLSSFTVSKVVINKTGKVVFFELRFDDYANAKALKDKWDEQVEDAIKRMPNWEPGTYNHKVVPFYLFEEIKVKL